MRILAIIPARYASSRFPAKLLAPVQGKSVLQRTYESVRASALIDDIIIATDDIRIQEHAAQFGATAVMTSTECKNGSERLIETLHRYPELTDADIIVNIQGDEPCIHKETIDKTVQALLDGPSELMATAAVPITDPDEIMSPSVVKTVLDQNGHALYFSRSPIPGYLPTKPYNGTYLKHLGIYAFRRPFLLKYATLANTPLQQIEDLEQLKVLEYGHKIRVVTVSGSSPHVDLPEDIKRVEQWLCKQNISL
jgi:3-deoxy-manno-octulosonate cytidylyltransferase (CMP-KDO synthetase)